MKTLAWLVGCTVLSLVAGCSGAESADGVDEGATVGAVTRCGPPTAPAAVQNASRCVEPTDVDEGRSVIAIVPTEDGSGRYTFLVQVDVSRTKTTFVFADEPYADKQGAERGAAALLRAALRADAYKVESEEGGSFVTIKAANNEVLARTSYVAERSTKKVISAVRKALFTAELSGLSEQYRAGWTADYQAKTFALKAGNGHTVLLSEPVPGGAEELENTMFDAHELAAKDAELAQGTTASSICNNIRDFGVEAWIGSFVIGQAEADGEYRYHLATAVPSQPAGGAMPAGIKAIASSATRFTTCEGAVEGVRTVTQILKAMPRG